MQMRLPTVCASGRTPSASTSLSPALPTLRSGIRFAIPKCTAHGKNTLSRTDLEREKLDANAPPTRLRFGSNRPEREGFIL